MAEEDGLLIEIAATEKRYLQQLARMEAATVRSAKKAESGWRKANPTMAKGFRDADRAAAGFANGGMRNVSMQLSQVAQQGAVTGDYVRALSIQLPDLALGFGAVGIAAGALAAVFAPMLIDMVSTGDKAKTLEEQLKNLATAMSALDEAVGDAGASPLDLIQEYGQYADQMQQVLLIQREMANLDAIMALKATNDAISEQFGSLQDLSGAREEVQRGWDGFQNTVIELASRFQISRAQATALAEALREVGRADGPEAQVSALKRAREQIELAAGGLANMDEEASAVYQGLLDAEMAAMRLAGVDMASNISSAADEAGRLAANLIAAYNLQNAREFKQTKQYSGRGSGRYEMGLAGGYSPPDTSDLFERAARKAQTAARKGRRGGGGGGKSDAEREQEQEQNRLLSERDRIVRSLETATERYERELSDINTLMEMGELTATQYAGAVGEIEERLVETKFAELIGHIESVSDAMAQAIVNGENMGEALGAVFQQIASDLISSGIKSLLMETFGLAVGGGESGGGGIFSSILGLFGGKRASGGPVSSGKAYLVGERGPEIFSPGANGQILNARQTQSVMKAGSAGGGAKVDVDVRAFVDQNGNWRAEVVRISSGVSRENIGEYSMSGAPRVQARVAGDPRVRY